MSSVFFQVSKRLTAHIHLHQNLIPSRCLHPRALGGRGLLGLGATSSTAAARERQPGGHASAAILPCPRPAETLGEAFRKMWLFQDGGSLERPWATLTRKLGGV